MPQRGARRDSERAHSKKSTHEINNIEDKTQDDSAWYTMSISQSIPTTFPANQHGRQNGISVGDGNLNEFLCVPDYHTVDQPMHNIQIYSSRPQNRTVTPGTCVADPLYGAPGATITPYTTSDSRGKHSVNTNWMSSRAPIAFTAWPPQYQDEPLISVSMCDNYSDSKSQLPLNTDRDNKETTWLYIEPSKKDSSQRAPIRVFCDMNEYKLAEYDKEFKKRNCIYPKAMVEPTEYQGNRLAYETDCNYMAWRLASLNPQLDSFRGLLQKAVDVYRNNHGDPSMKSRRAQRLAKKNARADRGRLSRRAR